VAPDITVAVSVTTLPEVIVVTALPPDVTDKVVVVVAANTGVAKSNTHTELRKPKLKLLLKAEITGKSFRKESIIGPFLIVSTTRQC
jgi:hypothetical protein